METSVFLVMQEIEGQSPILYSIWQFEADAKNEVMRLFKLGNLGVISIQGVELNQPSNLPIL
jgi:hypothetical protein